MMTFELTPEEISAVCANAIKQASDLIADELFKSGVGDIKRGKIQPTAEKFGVGVPYVCNVRDMGSLGTLKNSVLPVALKIITSKGKEQT